MKFLFSCFLAIGVLALARAHGSPPRNLVAFLRRMCQESATQRQNYRRLSTELAYQKQGIKRVWSEFSNLRSLVGELQQQVEYAVGPCGSSPCAKGTTCRVYGDSYRCECSNGYSGESCDAPKCSSALVEIPKTLPGDCQINVGACRNIKCNAAQNGCSWNTFCQPIMKEREFVCANTTYIQEVVTDCSCQLREKIEVRGRVVEQYGSDEYGIGSASMSVNDYHDEVLVDVNGYFNFDLPFCPGEVVLKVRAEGYVSTLKIEDVTSDTLGSVDNIEVVLFELAEPVTVVVGEENILETSGAAKITISDGTTFLDKNGNEVQENVNAILNFINPSDDDFRNSPGRFVTDEGEELVSLGLFNLIFENGVGDSLTPTGDIRIALVGLNDPEYKLWLLNSNGQWMEKISDPVVEGSQAFGGLESRKKRQTGSTDLGSFGTDDVGRWINLDKVSSASVCYIKTRVFDDMSFTSEVVVNGVDNYKPEFLLKIGASSPFQGLPLYRSSIISPGQTCFEVRCGTNPKTQGILSVITQETLGNGQSIPIPAIPVPVGHGELPSSLDTELASLNYEVNADKTEAKLDFESSTTGPLYQNKETCESSTLSDNSLWFARRSPVFTNTNLGSDVCYARVPLYQRQNTAPTNELLDQLQATSLWGNGPTNYANFVAQNSEFVHVASNDFACIRYRCSELSDLTTVFFSTVVTNVNVTCYIVNITAPILPQPIMAPSAPDTAIGTDSISTQSKQDRIHRNKRGGSYLPDTGYYFGVNEGTVKAECEAESDEMKTAGQVTCSTELN